MTEKEINDLVLNEIVEKFDEQLSPQFITDKLVGKYGEKYRPYIEKTVKNVNIVFYMKDARVYWIKKLIFKVAGPLSDKFNFKIKKLYSASSRWISFFTPQIIEILNKFKQAENLEEFEKLLTKSDIKLVEFLLQQSKIDFNALEILKECYLMLNENSIKEIETILDFHKKHEEMVKSEREARIDDDETKNNDSYKTLCQSCADAISFGGFDGFKIKFVNLNKKDLLGTDKKHNIIETSEVFKKYFEQNPDVLDEIVKYFYIKNTKRKKQLDENEIFKAFNYERFCEFLKKNNYYMLTGSKLEQQKYPYEKLFASCEKDLKSTGTSPDSKSAMLDYIYDAIFENDYRLESIYSDIEFLDMELKSMKSDSLFDTYSLKPSANSNIDNFDRGLIETTIETRDPYSSVLGSNMGDFITADVEWLVQSETIIHESIHSVTTIDEGGKKAVSGFSRLNHIDGHGIDEVTTEYMAQEVVKTFTDADAPDFKNVSLGTTAYQKGIRLIKGFLDCYHDEIVDFKLRQIPEEYLDINHKPSKKDEYILPKIFKHKDFIEMCHLLDVYLFHKLTDEEKAEYEEQIKSLSDKLVKLKKRSIKELFKRKDKKAQETEEELTV